MTEKEELTILADHMESYGELLLDSEAESLRIEAGVILKRAKYYRGLIGMLGEVVAANSNYATNQAQAVDPLLREKYLLTINSGETPMLMPSCWDAAANGQPAPAHAEPATNAAAWATGRETAMPMPSAWE